MAGNSIPNNATLTANTSPAGDILFSTKGFVAGDNYTIIIEVNKGKQREGGENMKLITETIEDIEVLTEATCKRWQRIQDKRCLYASGY